MTGIGDALHFCCATPTRIGLSSFVLVGVMVCTVAVYVGWSILLEIGDLEERKAEERE